MFPLLNGIIFLYGKKLVLLLCKSNITTMTNQNQPKPQFEDSIFQTAIFSEIQNIHRKNLLINAKAGSGKTTTIVRASNLIPATELTIFLAFNKSIVRELEPKLPSHVKVSTLHSWGFKEIAYKFGSVKVDESKVYKVIQKLIPTWGIAEEEISSYSNRVEKLVDMFRFALPQSREEVIELCEKHEIELLNGEIDRAKEVLIACRKAFNEAPQGQKTIDYTDMIYIPATNTSMKLRKFKNVFIDECQDLNRAQHEMLAKLIDPNGGRLIAVGDPNQSIYGFAGADIESFNRLRTLMPNTIELPLSFSYRCGTKIITHAQEIVSDILPSPTASAGEVRVGSFKEIQDGDFVLCRNTRPLVSMCMKFISEGRKATIKGGDIGKNLINMVKKTKAKSQDAMFNSLEKDYKKLVEKTKVIYPGKDAEKVSTVVNMSDKIGTLRAIADQSKTKSTEEIITTITNIFSDDNLKGIILSTMHKSKGLEADNVFIIEAQLCPAFYAMQPWQLEQEYNLMYVARTRAKKKLIYVNDWISDTTKMQFLEKAISDLNLNNY